MKRQLWVASFSIVASVAARGWAQAPGEAGATSGSANGSAAGSGDAGRSDGSASPGAGSAKSAAASENLKAQESLPQITAARGGSFGIPSSIQTAGLHAAVDAQLFDDKSNTDAFAQLAGLPVSSQVTADVVAQSVSQDVQRFVLNNDTVKPETFVASLSSAGMRIRIRGGDVLVVSHLQPPECLDALAQTMTDKDSKEKVSFFQLIGDGGLGIASTDENNARSVEQQVASIKPEALVPLEKAEKEQAEAAQDLAEKQRAIDALEALSTAKGINGLDTTVSQAMDKAKAAHKEAKITFDQKLKAAKDVETPSMTITAKDRNGGTHTFLASEVKPKLDRVKAACNLDQIRGLSGRTLTFGAHVLRRSSNAKDGKASVGGALEAMYQRDNLNRTAYLGLSFEYLNRALDKDSGAQFDFVSFHALRVSAGYEYRGSHATNGTDLLPRVGVYGVASYGWWHDSYTFTSAGGKIDEDVHSTELEAGLYAGGKFTNNFTGVLALRVLKPFGDFNQGTTFIISLIPAVSAGK